MSNTRVELYRQFPLLTIRPPHIDPPADASPFDWQGKINMPAIPSANIVILSFTVPRGLNGMIKKYGNEIDGGVAGAFSYAIRHDSQPFPYYSNILFSLGPVDAPVEHPLGLRVLENQVITFVFTNTSVIPAGQSVLARVMGFYYPKEYDDPSIRIVQ